MCTGCSRITTRYGMGGVPGGSGAAAGRGFVTWLSPQYVVQCHGQTLLPRFLGMYRVSVDSEDTYLLVMRNLFSHRLPVHRKYDLKVLGCPLRPPRFCYGVAAPPKNLRSFLCRAPSWIERPATRRRYCRKMLGPPQI